MQARIEVQAEHLGGPAAVSVSVDLEPESVAWNEVTFHAMARTINRLLGAMFDERDRIRFEDEQRALGAERAQHEKLAVQEEVR